MTGTAVVRSDQQKESSAVVCQKESINLSSGLVNMGVGSMCWDGV